MDQLPKLHPAVEQHEKRRSKVFERDHAICNHCKQFDSKWTVDHIIPRAINRKNAAWFDELPNLQTLCHYCHCEKTIEYDEPAIHDYRKACGIMIVRYYNPDPEVVAMRLRKAKKKARIGRTFMGQLNAKIAESKPKPKVKHFDPDPADDYRFAGQYFRQAHGLPEPKRLSSVELANRQSAENRLARLKLEREERERKFDESNPPLKRWHYSDGTTHPSVTSKIGPHGEYPYQR